MYQLTPYDFADENAASKIRSLADMGESYYLFYSNGRLYASSPHNWYLQDITHLVSEPLYRSDNPTEVCGKVAHSIDAIFESAAPTRQIM